MTKHTLLCRTTAAKGGTGDASATITTASVDRDGDQVDPAGLDVSKYLRNPVVLYAHDYQALPVGRCVALNRTGDQWRAQWTWLQKDDFADRVRNAWDQQVLSACSIGFRPLASQPRPDANGGRLFTAAELLEFSIVPVPSNQEALRALKAFGLVARSGRVLSGANRELVTSALEALGDAQLSHTTTRRHLTAIESHCRSLLERADGHAPNDADDDNTDNTDDDRKSVLDVEDDDIDPQMLAFAVRDVLVEMRDAVYAARNEARRRAGFGVDALPDPRARHDSLNDLIAREVQSAVNRARGRVD